jgi:hypothetical protein
MYSCPINRSCLIGVHHALRANIISYFYNCVWMAHQNLKCMNFYVQSSNSGSCARPRLCIHQRVMYSCLLLCIGYTHEFLNKTVWDEFIIRYIAHVAHGSFSFKMCGFITPPLWYLPISHTIPYHLSVCGFSTPPQYLPISYTICS